MCVVQVRRVAALSVGVAAGVLRGPADHGALRGVAAGVGGVCGYPWRHAHPRYIASYLPSLK